MNIFFLSMCVIDAAQSLCDMHSSKMFLELVQVITAVFAHYTSDQRAKELDLYRITHRNHPIVKWVQASSTNYKWALELGFAMSDEYMKRYGKSIRHKSHEKLMILHAHSNEILDKFPTDIMTLPPLCMPVEYQVSKDPVVSYRYYYRHAKFSFAKWKNNTPPPQWWNEMDADENLIIKAEKDRQTRLKRQR